MANLSGHAPPSMVIGVTVSLTIVAALAVFSRLFTRRVIVHNLGWDDALATLALLLSGIMTLTVGTQVQYGLTQHVSSLIDPPENLPALLRSFWASIWLYNLGVACVKESILLQFLRIFPHGRHRTACHVLMVVILIHALWSTFSAIFFCRPVNSFWEESAFYLPPTAGDATCFDRTAVWFANATINILFDITLAILPIPVLQTIDKSAKQKYALMAVFSLGGATCIFSLLRLPYLYTLSTSTDPSWDIPATAIWSSVELNMALVASCLPTLKACLHRLFPRFRITFNAGLVSSHNVFQHMRGGGEKRGSIFHTVLGGEQPSTPSSGNIACESMERTEERSDSQTHLLGRTDEVKYRTLPCLPPMAHVRGKKTGTVVDNKVSLETLVRELGGGSVPAMGLEGNVSRGIRALSGHGNAARRSRAQEWITERFRKDGLLV